MLCRVIGVVVLLASVGAAWGQNLPPDRRHAAPKNYNSYFPWTPPTSKEAWAKRKQEVREQVLVANGLWPMPEKISLQPVVHGKIQRDGYTIEKVFFASLPGHYVTGNLYRPIGKTGKLPAVLNPHGHWSNGRFFEASLKVAQDQLKPTKAGTIAESTLEGATYPLQARCAQLARMGCVAFHYDMVGYADSQQIKHRDGFLDVEAELRLQNFMGLQTYNSIRALDFLLSLPDVDPTRVGVTGASGGGTQTFLLCGIDERPAAAFPAVMVSTGMQGGCICENCSYLRVGTGNIELAGLWAPKPLGMAAANDWTKEIETKGLPELKALYKLLGVPDNVMAKAHLEFGHNYNQVSREIMYNFFNKHLKLGQSEPVAEKPFVPVPPKELSVYDAQHPLPKDATGVEGLRRHLTQEADRQLLALVPKDAASLAEFRRVLGTGLRVMVGDTLPPAGEVKVVLDGNRGDGNGFFTYKSWITRQDQGEAVPVMTLRPKDSSGRVVIWVHPDGWSSLWQNDKLVPAAQKVIDARGTIVVPEVWNTGHNAKKPAPIKGFAGYYFGYNRPLVAERVHDILTTVAFVQGHKDTKEIDLLGLDKAGPWVVLARGLCGSAVKRTAADLDQFRFEQVKSFDDDMMLPGALKYGGLPALAALSAPHEVLLHNSKGAGSTQWLQGAYEAAGEAGNLQRREEQQSAVQAVEWLLRK